MTSVVASIFPRQTQALIFSYPSMSAAPGNRARLSILNRLNGDTGLPTMQELDASQRGAGGISFIDKYNHCLAGMGAIGGNGHRLAISQLVQGEPNPMSEPAVFCDIIRGSGLENSSAQFD